MYDSLNQFNFKNHTTSLVDVDSSTQSIRLGTKSVVLAVKTQCSTTDQGNERMSVVVIPINSQSLNNDIRAIKIIKP